MMDWPILLKIIEMAGERFPLARGKKDRGWSFCCYCRVCCELRRL